MTRRRSGLVSCARLALFSVAALCAAGMPFAAEVVMRDGRILSGKVALLHGIADNPDMPKHASQSVLMVDTGLCRYFVSNSPLEKVAVREPVAKEKLEHFIVPQTIPEGGLRIASIGALLRIDPFDKHGRRIVRMQASAGVVDVIQGITEITPVWTKVVALKKYLWEQRIATSSIPRETLNAILTQLSGDPKNINERLKIVRLFLQSERYHDARHELDQIIKDFPEHKEEFGPTAQRLTQFHAQKILDEVDIRAKSGQHELAYNMLDKFPADDVAGEILQEVREKLDKYKGQMDQRTEVLTHLKADAEAIDDSNLRERLRPVIDEMAAELNINTLDRMDSYRLLWADDSLSVNEKLALAIDGWLLGAEGAARNLPVALSAYEVRGLVHRYMNEPAKPNRTKILQALASQEAATPQTVARILAHMKPPLDTPPAEAGFFELSVPGRDNLPVTYFVQLPPAYDPYRRYPTILTLHGGATTPQLQIDWWSGSREKDGSRLGHAARQGYIVVAPAWGKEHQRQYDFSSREHCAVLYCLRDACRRFAVDTDRIYLSGHSMGGDAAWDIGLAHPDLWAGVIPVVAAADKFCHRYWPNGRYVPYYFINGELDGDLMVNNAPDLDRYLRYTGFRVTVVEFLGRGHENFSDEILKLFDWMGRYRRNFYPKKFTCHTMRAWDNFFWWLEMSDMPEKSMIDPEDWPPPRGVSEVQVSGTVQPGNVVSVKTGAGKVSVFLTPDMIDFNSKAKVLLNGAKLNPKAFIEPDLAVLLEDVFSRGDRQHPFWAKVESPAAAAVAKKPTEREGARRTAKPARKVAVRKVAER